LRSGVIPERWPRFETLLPGEASQCARCPPSVGADHSPMPASSAGAPLPRRGRPPPFLLPSGSYQGGRLDIARYVLIRGSPVVTDSAHSLRKG
jgi:hypothetical protein